MKKLWRIFAIILFAKIITADNECGPSKYKDECSCTGYNAYFVMDCPPTETIETVNFKIQFKPHEYVMITCVNNPSWSTFHYEISPVVHGVRNFVFRNCTFEGDVSVNEIARLVGAVDTQNLEFSNNLNHKNLILKRDHLQWFTNVTRLTITENYLLGDLDEDLLQHLPQLTTLVLRNNKLKSVPKNFFQSVPNLVTLELGNNKIQRFDPETFRNLKELTMLNLWGNELLELNSETIADLVSLRTLDLHNNNLTTLPQGFFDRVDQLEVINLSGNQFETLPSDLFLKNRKLRIAKLRTARKLKNLPSGLFKQLKALTVVQLDGCSLENLPESLFEGSTKITEIQLGGNLLQSLPVKIFDKLEKLSKLFLQNNRLEDLPDNLFSSCTSLKELSLSQNKILNISSSLFRGLSNLEKLSLNNNEVADIDKNAFVALEKIQRVNLSHNKIKDLKVTSAGYGDISVFHACRNLKELDLSHNEIPVIFSDWIVTPPSSFRKLDLSHNAITVLMNEDLDFKHTQDFNINLSNNKIKLIDLGGNFEQRFLDEQRSRIEVDLQNNPVECDCFLYDFIRYLDGTMDMAILEKLKLNVDSIECSSPKYLQGTLLSDLKSKDYKCIPSRFDVYDDVTLCPKSCSQWKRPFDQTLIFDCANQNLTAAPETLCNLANQNYLSELNLTGNFLTDVPSLHQLGYDKVKALLVSHNQITTIRDEALTDTLKVLELHDNKMTALFLERLTNSSLQRVTLGGNPWKCDCRTRAFHRVIQIGDLPISDVQNVTCANSQRELKSITVNELCLDELMLLILVICMALAFSGFITAAYYRYRTEIKIWLFAHQRCLWLVSEDELDKDKIYDAFISYSHEDEDFVVKELVTKLESGPRPFKLCIHFRDWLAGEWIPQQIVNSVKDSKRTIVVVSPNFLKSEWGLLEFRAAHRQALNEGRSRIIMVLYGDIGPTDNLEGELKAYLSMNTYVKWGDPWFWYKLQYAMPHKSEWKGIDV